MSQYNRSVRMIVGPVLAIGVALAGVTALVAATRQADSARPAAEAAACVFGMVPGDPTEHSQSDLPPPPTSGRVEVLDVLGNTRGAIDLADLYRVPKEIPSTEQPGIFDVPVTDRDGKLTGYWVPEYGGFVDLESARTPGILNQLVADPTLVVDSEGNLLTAGELEQRKRAGTACVR